MKPKGLKTPHIYVRWKDDTYKKRVDDHVLQCLRHAEYQAQHWKNEVEFWKEEANSRSCNFGVVYNK